MGGCIGHRVISAFESRRSQRQFHHAAQTAGSPVDESDAIAAVLGQIVFGVGDDEHVLPEQYADGSEGARIQVAPQRVRGPVVCRIEDRVHVEHRDLPAPAVLSEFRVIYGAVVVHHIYRGAVLAHDKIGGIAEQLAAKLDYEFIDRRLVEEIASITDTSVEEVERYDEKGEGRLRFFLKKLLVPEVAPGTFPLSAAAYAPEFGLEFPHMREHEVSEATYLDRGTYQLLITTLVQDFGQTGKAVVVGRASQVVLADFPNACHVKIIAPLETRIERLMQTRDMDREQAQKLIEQHDQWRQSYLRNFHKADWNDPLLYDLTINTGKIDREDAVDLLAGFLTES